MEEQQIPEHSCYNCTFLCSISDASPMFKQYYPIYYEIEKRKRKQFIEDHNPRTMGVFFIGCRHGVWKENKDFDEDKGYIFDKIVDNRNNFCYFWEYREGMAPDGGVELQKREQENEKFYTQLRNTRRSAWAAIISALVAALGLIANLVYEIWFK